ncbi:MAG: hypothetical protein IV090_26990 [Candidatus Sericytochromatia bacterium]|nr:hypothetical protein [Candidatus Sericytochromatia bacterium]
MAEQILVIVLGEALSGTQLPQVQWLGRMDTAIRMPVANGLLAMMAAGETTMITITVHALKAPLRSLTQQPKRSSAAQVAPQVLCQQQAVQATAQSFVNPLPMNPAKMPKPSSRLN